VYVRLEGCLIDDEGPTLDLGLADTRTISEDQAEAWAHEVDAMGIWHIVTGLAGEFHGEPYWLAMIDMGLFVGQQIVVEGEISYHRDYWGEWDVDYELGITHRGPLTDKMVQDTLATLEREYAGWALMREEIKARRKKRRLLVETGQIRHIAA
jgi:hypothetical protein